MKHTLKITLILILIFLIIQTIGIFVISKYYSTELIDGNKIEKLNKLPYDLDYPEFNKQTSYIPIIILFFIGTIFALILVRLNANFLWKLWFIFTITLTCAIALTPFLGSLISGIIAIALALLKVFKRNIITHNLPELIMYSGLAVIFFNIFSTVSIIILLAIISVYDMIAVWKTKHMVKLAKYQTKLKVFAGLMIPYGKKSENLAILGGGDMGFPLIFAAVLFKDYGFYSLIISLFASLGLLALLMKSKKKKFYPAMPFITAGCLIGFLILKLIF